MPEFENVCIHSRLLNKQGLLVLKSERITIVEKLYHGSVLALDSSAVRAPARKVGDPVSRSGPG